MIQYMKSSLVIKKGITFRDAMILVMIVKLLLNTLSPVCAIRTIKFNKVHVHNVYDEISSGIFYEMLTIIRTRSSRNNTQKSSSILKSTAVWTDMVDNETYFERE